MQSRCVNRHALFQTPSTGLRHPSLGGMCRKEMLGVWSSVCVDDMDGSADGLDTLRHDGQVNVTVLCMNLYLRPWSYA